MATAALRKKQRKETIYPDESAPPDPSKIFVVHGRNAKARDALFQFLRSIGLKPLEWSQAVRATQRAAPYIGEVLDAAFSNAQAIVVLMTPDDMAYLREPLRGLNEPPFETAPTPQPRPNVLFEAGMAMGRHPHRTILVEVGDIRPFSDVGGRHAIRLKNSSQSRQDLADRLEIAGCPVDLSGRDWHTAGDFRDVLTLFDSQSEDITGAEWRWISVHHFVNVKQVDGKDAEWIKESVAVPMKEQPIWKDLGIRVEGRITDFATNIGRLLLPPSEEGGEFSLITVFDPPLEKGKTITKSLRMRVRDSFTLSNESIKWRVGSKFQELGFHISLPKARPCKGMPKAYGQRGVTSFEIRGTNVSDSGTNIDLVIRDPKPDTEYVVAWVW